MVGRESPSYDQAISCIPLNCYYAYRSACLGAEVLVQSFQGRDPYYCCGDGYVGL